MLHRLPIVLVLVVLGLSSACVVRTASGTGTGPGPRVSERRDDRHDAAFDANSPWDKLGERWVVGSVDRDVIQVGKKEGHYKRIKIVVEHSAIELFDITVVFGNGEKFSPGARMVFGPNSTSREIDLPGGARYIDHVEFRYGNLPGGGRAQVELWGLGRAKT